MGYRGESQPPDLENLLSHRVKMVVQCIPAGVLNGPRTIGQLMLLEKRSQTKDFCRAISGHPSKKFSEITSLRKKLIVEKDPILFLLLYPLLGFEWNAPQRAPHLVHMVPFVALYHPHTSFMFKLVCCHSYICIN